MREGEDAGPDERDEYGRDSFGDAAFLLGDFIYLLRGREARHDSLRTMQRQVWNCRTPPPPPPPPHTHTHTHTQSER